MSVQFNPQAYLMWKKFYKNGKISDNAINNRKGKIPIHTISGRYAPTETISKLINNEKINVYRDILNLETYKISSLVPMIKIFKIFGGKYTPFYFPNSVEANSIKEMFGGFGGGASGVGIKSFSMNLQGSDMFTRDKNIECSLTIYVENMELIFRAPPPGYARLADLFTISNRAAQPLAEGLDKEVFSDQVHKPSNFEIQVTVGYSVPDRGEIFEPKEKDAIESTNMSLRMTMTDHSIDVGQDGSATINISYIGRIAGLLNSGTHDVMSTPIDIFHFGNIISGMGKVDSGSPNGPPPAKVSKTKKKIELLKIDEIKKIITNLDKEKKIHDHEISEEDFKEFRKLQNKWEAKKPGKAEVEEKSEDASVAKTPIPESKPAKVNDTEDSKEDEVNIIAPSVSYFTLGDLLTAVLHKAKTNVDKAFTMLAPKNKSKLSEVYGVLTKAQEVNLKKHFQAAKQEYESFRVLLGNMSINVGSNGLRTANIADIPISLSCWSQFVFEEIVNQSMASLSLHGFMNSLVTWLIPHALNDHAQGDAKFLKQNTEIKSLSLTGGDLDRKAKALPKIKVKNLPDFLMRIPSRNVKDEVDYVVFYSAASKTSESGRKGDLFKDGKDGIHHLHLAKDRGMVKNISFSRFDVPYKKESLMVNSVSLYDELRMPYNASISMVGNTLFYPGTMVYINTSNMGFGDPRNNRSAAARLGIGGYYQILGVSTTFTPQSMTTELQTSYLSWADGTGQSMADTLREAGIDDMTRRLETAVTEGEEQEKASVESTAPRPTFSRTELPRSDLNFIFVDENLLESEKVALRNLLTYGEESVQYRDSLTKEDLVGARFNVLANVKQERTVLVEVVRSSGEKITVSRTGDVASVTRE